RMGDISTLLGNSANLDAANDQHIHNTYDAAGRLLSSTDAENGTEHYTYDGLGNKKTYVNKLGYTWTYVYDAAGRMTEEDTPPVSVYAVGTAPGAPAGGATSSSLALVTKMVYDAFGNVVEHIENASAADKTQSRVTSYRYDVLGRQVRTINADTYTDAASVTYGSKVGVYAAGSDATNGYGSSLTPGSPTSLATRSGFENSQALTADTLYDAQGNAIVGRDAAGNYSYKVYDSLGRVAYEIDTGRYVTQYQYNSFGDQSVLIRYAVAINPADATTGGTSTLTSLETALNTALANPGSLAALNAASAAQVKAAALAKAFVANTSNSRSLTTTYDQLDRKKTVAQPAVDYFAPTLTVGTNYIGTASPTTAYSYDAFGDLVTQTALSYPQSVTTTFGYDRLARQTDLVDLGGYYTNNTYDAFNRVIQSWQYAKPVTTAPTALANGMWSFTKPAATAPAANDPLGYDRITQYAYDRLDRQIRVTKVNTTYSYLDPSAASGVTTVTGNTVTSSAYDAIGNLIASTGADGNVTRSYYDALGRLIATGGPTTATANATARTISLQYQVISQKGWQSGSNVVSVNWSSLQTWSGAGLQVVLTYNGYDTTTGAAFSNRTQTVALGMGAAGNTFNWSTDTLGSVVSVVVQVNTGTVAAPNWKTAYTSAAPTKWIEVGNIPASATVVQFQYRPHNSTTAWTTVTMGPGPIAGIWLAGVPAGLGTGDYDYHVSATDQSGNPISLAAPDGRATVTRSGDGSVAMLSDGSAPSLTTMGYDALGDLVMQKRLANGATSLSATSYVAGAADAINDQVSYQRYDILGHVLESVDALGHSEFHSYDQFGHELRTWRAQTDVLGTAVQQTTLYTYDALGRQTGTIAVRRSPDQANSVYTLDKTQALYNAYGEQIASGADLSHVIDSSGKATLSGASSFAAIGATYADYDNAGRLWQTNSGDGVDKVERYDLLGHHTAEILIPSATASTVNATPTERRLNGVADLSGITGAIETDTVYDALGHAIEQRQPSFVQNGTTVAPKVDQTFDRWGNVLSVTDPRVAAWGNRYRYNDQNQVISSDRLEVDTAVDEHGGTIANVAASQYFYDARGNLIETLTPDGATGLATVRHQRLYDAAGELVDEVDSLGANIVHAYDRLNRQIQQVDADGHVTTYAYDRLDQLIEQDQLGFANNANPIYQYHYDESGNRISSTDGIAADLTRDRYDTRGNLITELTPLTTVGNANLGSIYKTSYTYDALGHKIKTTDGDNNTQTWAIDAFGRQTAHTDLGGMVTTDTYDSLGRLLHETSAQATLTNDGSDLSGWLWTSSNSANEVGGGQLNGSNSFTEAMVQPDYGSPSAGPDGLAAGKPAILLHVSQGSYSQISRSLGLRSSTTFSVSADLLLDQASGSGPQQAAIYFGSSGRTGPKLELNSGNQQGVLKYTDGNGGTISKAYSYTRGDWLRVVVSGTRNADGTYQTTFSLIDLSTGGNTILTFSAGAKFAGDEVAFSAENGGEDNGNAVVVDNIDIKGGVNAGEDQTYAYYANGELSTLTDNANQTVTTYQYDAAGHHTLEKFASSGGTVYQNASLAYDSQGRLISDTDSGRSNGSGATITNRYDAAGNRREITSSFTAGSTGGTSGTTDHWYTYDDENRILIAEGKKDASNNIVLDSSDTNSASLAYDAAGNRRNETQYQNGNLTYLSYNYDPANRLTATYTSSVAGQLGAQTSGRSYDSAGRVLSYFEKFSQTGYYQPGAQDAYVYNLNGELLEQRHSENGTLQYAVGYAANSGTTYSKDAASPVATSAGWYDGAGTLSHYEYVATTDNVRVSYDYRYRKADGYQESLIIGKETSNDASNGHEGVTTQSYDSNNHLIKLIDQYNDTPTRKYVVNGQGQTVLRNDSNGKSQSTFWGNNIEVGSGGGISANQFDFNYTPISAQYPSTVPAQYVLQSGDTLESIALLSYGDASLWYLIADANGVSSDADLQNLSIGTALTIPNVVSNVHNNADTFKPYDPRSVIGDTTPTIQPPPPPQHACEELATIIGAVVRAVVTIVSSFIPYVGPYIAPALGAAAGDVAKQDVELIADGKFNFGKYFEYAWIDPLLLASKQAGGSNFSVHEVELAAGSAEAGSLGSMIGGPLLGNVAGQYFNMTNNAQHGFDWGSLAGTVVSSALTGGSSYDPVANFVGGVGAAYTQKWITHGRHQERVDFAGIAANAYADAAISLFSYKGDDSGSGGEGFSLNGFNFNWGGTNGFSFNYSGDYGFGLLGQWTADAFGNEQGNSVVGAVGTAPGEMQAASDTQWGGANDPTAGGDVDSTPYQAQPGYRVGIGNSDGSIGYGTVSPDGYGYTDAADQGAPIVGRTSSQGKTTGMIFMRADGTEEVAPYNNVPPDTAAPTDTPSDANQAAAMASTGTSTGENAAAAIQQVGALNTKQSDSGSGFVDLVGIFSRNFSDSFFNTTDSYGTHLGDQAFTLKSEGFYATDIGKSLQSIGDFLSVDIDSALNGGVGSTKTAGGVRATGDFLNYLFTQSDNLQNAQDFVGDKLTSLSDWSNNTTPDQKAALAGQVGGKLVVDLGVAEAGGELTQAARSVELGGDAGKLEETAADVAKVGERAKYLDDLKALRNEINRRAQAAVQQVRDDIANGATVKNPGSLAHDYLARDILSLQDELDAAGSSYRVAAEQFRDLKTGRIVQENLPSAIRPAGSIGLDVVAYDNGTLVEGLDLKTYQNVPHGFSRSQLADLSRVFKIPQSNITQIFIKR
ncbi:MAG: LysM peptidoglycan-binding protein, partial [Nevskia sp.]|nr:LysM peptidoglycan-binding protein [Nevskia sp.]